MSSLSIESLFYTGTPAGHWAGNQAEDHAEDHTDDQAGNPTEDRHIPKTHPLKGGAYNI